MAVQACGADETAKTPVKGEKGRPAVEDSESKQEAWASAGKLGAGRGADQRKEARRCEERCLAECADQGLDFAKFVEANRGRVKDTPFQIEVHRAYLKGGCHEGNEPARRPDAAGISAVVEGSLTYNGDDILYEADLGGALFLVFGDDKYAHANAEKRGLDSARQGFQFMRQIRGSDPWFKGEIRGFHWESSPINPVYCEISPERAEAFLDIETVGIYGGKKTSPLTYIPLAWNEVVGMALQQQVRVMSGEQGEDEPAEAHYSKLDRILVTRLTGETGWVKRTSILSSGMLKKAPGATFPINEKSPEWEIQIKGISDVAEFGGYVPEGEDQSLVVIPTEFKYAPVRDDVLPPSTGSLKNLSVRLETSPGKWQKPVARAMGQLDTSVEAMPGAKLSGNLVFVRQRFERPFRLEMVTPDGVVLYLDVLSYDIGPKRGLRK
jgi:hypothetical protein